MARKIILKAEYTTSDDEHDPCMAMVMLEAFIKQNYEVTPKITTEEHDV